MSLPNRHTPSSAACPDLSAALLAAKASGQLAADAWPALRALLLTLAEAHAVGDGQFLQSLLLSEVPMSHTFRKRASTSAAMMLRRRVQKAGMLDDCTVAVILTNPQHQIAFWNAGATDLYGWTATEVCGRCLSAVLPIERWVDGSRERMQAALRSQGHWSGHLIQRPRDGRPVLLAATICVVAALPPHWLLSIARPIKEPQPCARTQADALLLSSLRSTAPFAIAFLDRQLRFLEVNEALAAISSLPSAAHRGRSVAER